MKNWQVILGIVVASVALGIVAFTFGDTSFLNDSSTGNAQVKPVAVKFRELAKGTRSTEKDRKNYIITSQDQMAELWKIIDLPEQPPTVNFADYDVIAVFAGEEPTAGYEIVVTKVEDFESRMITITTTKPGETCLAAPSITAPYHIIEIAKSALPLAHADEDKTIGCLR